MNRDLRVDAYIARCPRGTRRQLTTLRNALRTAEPKAEEVVSYGMPGYRFPGYSYRGMFAWFGLQSKHIGLYLRPPTIQLHRRQLAQYGTTKSAVHLPLEGELPLPLIRKLVKASARLMRRSEP